MNPVQKENPLCPVVICVDPQRGHLILFASFATAILVLLSSEDTTDTTAPSSSNAFLIAVAASSDILSMTTQGTFSVISFASFSPNPVTSLTSLIAFTLFTPAFSKITAYSLVVRFALPKPAIG